MRKINTNIFKIVILLSGCLIYSQSTNSYSERLITYDNDIRESNLVTVKFSELVFNLSQGVTITNVSDLPNQYNLLKGELEVLENLYGTIALRKRFPNAVWGDIIRTNRRSGATVEINDLSQIFALEFSQMVPIDDIINTLNSLQIVEWAHGPVQAVSYDDPNDYDPNDQWYLDKINASDAWDITHGSEDIKIAIIDGNGFATDHPDLSGKWVPDLGDVSSIGSHGTEVAGIAGAMTNNNQTGIASLGWLTSLIPYSYVSNQTTNNDLAEMVDLARTEDADIMVCSFGTIWYNSSTHCDETHSYELVETAFENALTAGIIVVAAWGNSSLQSAGGCPPEFDVFPWVPYPASYRFPPEKNEVIGVTATTETDNFREGYNYTAYPNGIGMVDICAPGVNILTTSRQYAVNTYLYKSGTSYSTPMIAALASLILALDINDNMSATMVQDIIKATADKVDSQQYPYDTDGWNNHMGYGRINAYEALYLVDSPPSTPTGLSISGSIGQHPTINWDSNSEADIKAYKVYRKRIGVDNNYVYRATVNAPNTSYTDNGITIYVGRFSAYVYYKIKAMDVIDNLSPYSNWVRTKYRNQVEQKIQQIPTEFALHTAYPNPFNPLTKIKYQLPEESFVVLKIYDLMGREMKTIVKGTENAGYKNIMWDSKDNNGRHVPSGMYFYRLDVLSKESDREFHETRKMVLLR